MKFIYLFIILFAVGCSTSERAKVNVMTKATVMITNLAENSGGSGTIITSAPDMSLILTNAHVCEVVKKGGYVHSYLGKSFVSRYLQSEIHDLCLISVKDDLHVKTPVAANNPNTYEEVYVSGHPHLMSTIVTQGWTTGKMVVSIMTRIRPCTSEELDDKDKSLFCLLAGGIPMVKTYETTPVSATIQPGSSGSAVYNNDGQVSSVIFAGRGDLAYGLSVPHEYVLEFLTTEHKNLPAKSPELEVSALGGDSESHQSMSEAIHTACKSSETPGQKKLCAQFESELKYTLMGAK